MPTLPFSMRLLLGGCAALLVAGNCRLSPPLPNANTALLTSAPWRIVAYTTTDNTARPAQVVNSYAALPAYRRDDTYQFDTEGNFAFYDGPLRAAATDPQYVAGTWQFQANETALLLTLPLAVPLVSAPNTPTIFDLHRLSADTLRLSSGPPAQTVQLTLAH